MGQERRESTREENAELFPGKTKERTIVGWGEERSLCDTESLSYEKEGSGEVVHRQ